MEQYMLHNLLPLCQPLDRIKRRGWLDKGFIVIPNSVFTNCYIHNYTGEVPAIKLYAFCIDDLQSVDWIKL
jgi:hypothetical protein